VGGGGWGGGGGGGARQPWPLERLLSHLSCVCSRSASAELAVASKDVRAPAAGPPPAAGGAVDCPALLSPTPIRGPGKCSVSSPESADEVLCNNHASRFGQQLGLGELGGEVVSVGGKTRDSHTMGPPKVFRPGCEFLVVDSPTKCEFIQGW
jgi:hypothetical protein